MKRLINRNNIIALILLIVFIILIVAIKIDNISSIDNFGYDLLVENRTDSLTNIMKIITTFGSAGVLVSLMLVIFLLIDNKKDALFGTINLGIAFIVNDLIKFLIARPRPEGFRLIEESGYSFTSGHAMVSCAVYGYLIYLIYKGIKNKGLKYSLIGVLSLLIFLIAISRVYLGIHYLSDVIGGRILASIYLIIFIQIIKGDKHEKSKKKN